MKTGTPHLRSIALVVVELFLWTMLATDISWAMEQDCLRPPALRSSSARELRGLMQLQANDGGDRYETAKKKLLIRLSAIFSQEAIDSLLRKVNKASFDVLSQDRQIALLERVVTLAEEVSTNAELRSQLYNTYERKVEDELEQKGIRNPKKDPDSDPISLLIVSIVYPVLAAFLFVLPLFTDLSDVPLSLPHDAWGNLRGHSPDIPLWYALTEFLQGKPIIAVVAETVAFLIPFSFLLRALVQHRRYHRQFDPLFEQRAGEVLKDRSKALAETESKRLRSVANKVFTEFERLRHEQVVTYMSHHKRKTKANKLTNFLIDLINYRYIRKPGSLSELPSFSSEEISEALQHIFPQFSTEELKPFEDSLYKTLSGLSNTPEKIVVGTEERGGGMRHRDMALGRDDWDYYYMDDIYGPNPEYERLEKKLTQLLTEEFPRLTKGKDKEGSGDPSAEDGGRRSFKISKPRFVWQTPRIEKRNIVFNQAGRFAEGRAVLFDPKEVDLRILYHEAARTRDYYETPKPRIGLPLKGYVALEKDRESLLAVNGLQGDLTNPNAFLIAQGRLIHKEDVRGFHEEIPEPLNGEYSVLVLGEHPRVAKVRIENNELKTQEINFAFQGPPLLIDGKDVTDQIRQHRIFQDKGVEKKLPQQGDEVTWNPKANTGAFSAIGVMEDGRMVILSMRGDPERQGELYVKEVAQVLKAIGVRDALLLGGSADVQQYLRSDRQEWIIAKPRGGTETPLLAGEEARPVGTAILVYPKSAETGSVEVSKVKDASKDGGSKTPALRIEKQLFFPRPLLSPMNRIKIERQELLTGV